MGKVANRKRDYENESIDITVPRKKFHLKDLATIHGKTENQQNLIDAYLNTDTETFLLTGYPGTGKTFLACWLALNDVLSEDHEPERLVIFRSAVETRKQGFVPGDEIEKSAIYESPYPPVMQDIFNIQYKQIYNNLKQLGLVEFHTTSNQRGVTFDNAVMIIDEAQNMTLDEIETIYTRSGYGCRVIICGDMGQNDLVHYRGENSGLSEFERILSEMPSVSKHGFYELDDIVRSGRIRDYIEAKIKLGLV
jgi:phosphate starvation-inducible protein PhoH